MCTHSGPTPGEAEQRHDALTQMDAPRALARDYPQSKAKYRAGFLAQNSAPMQKVLGTGAAAVESGAVGSIRVAYSGSPGLSSTCCAGSHYGRGTSLTRDL